MTEVGEKGRPGTHTGEMTTFAFDTQILMDVTLLCYQAHQGFRLMRIELIGDEDPGGVPIGLDGLGNVCSEVSFGARGSNAGSNDLSGSHLQIGNQALRAMPLVFEFHSLNMPGLHGQGRVEPRSEERRAGKAGGAGG